MLNFRDRSAINKLNKKQNQLLKFFQSASCIKKRWAMKRKPAYLKYICLIIASSLFFIWLHNDWKNQRNLLAAEKKAELMIEFGRKKEKFEDLFTLTYQTIRAISLLPSVRAIAGGNRLNEEDDVVAQGRFTIEGHETVQQLYNNLAEGSGVSELYCVVEGLDAVKGEIPFFMFDSLIIDKNIAGQKEKEQDHEKNTDEPEESEAAEYDYYPKQINFFRQTYPVFDGRSLESIKAVSSPVMRTCDNSQYVSKSTGDVKNAEGILYSVPFFAAGSGKLRGIISAVFRTNVFEAMLLDIPFIPVTEEDSRKAGGLGFSMPEKQSGYALVNPTHGVVVCDRRNSELKAVAETFSKNKTSLEEIHFEKLKAKDSSEWYMLCKFDMDRIIKAYSVADASFRVKLLGLISATLFILLWIFFSERKKRQLLGFALMMKDISDGDGNLTKRLPETSRDERREIAFWFNRFIDKLHKIISGLIKNAETLGNETAEIKTISEKQFFTAETTKELSGSVSKSCTLISEKSFSIGAASDQVSQSALTVNDSINGMQKALIEISAYCDSELAIKTEAEKRTAEADEIVGKLEKASTRIGKITEIINDIADQTNLLAINAHIEAAKAGEYGKGFAVIASEIKNLALKSSESVNSIAIITSEMISDSYAVSDTINNITNILEKINHNTVMISEAVSKQLRATEIVVSNMNETIRSSEILKENAKNTADYADSVASDAKMLDDEAHNSLSNARETSRIAERLAWLSEELRKAAIQFKT